MVKRVRNQKTTGNRLPGSATGIAFMGAMLLEWGPKVKLMMEGATDIKKV